MRPSPARAKGSSNCDYPNERLETASLTVAVGLVAVLAPLESHASSTRPTYKCNPPIVSLELSLDWDERAFRCSQAWNLSKLEWYPGVSTARIGLCESPFGPAVLKVSNYPDLIACEVNALRHFGASICPKVLEVSRADHAILLERVHVNHDLTTLFPAAEQEIDLWLPFFHEIVKQPDIPEGFPTLADYARVFERVIGGAQQDGAARVLRFAHDNRDVLMGPPSELRLLHGDLHHFNLLCDTGGKWWMIDPHGVVGNPLYEIGAFIRNPMPRFYREPGFRNCLEERLTFLSERLCVPVEVVALYGFYGAAFSIAWDYEDGNTSVDPKIIELAEVLVMLSGKN